MLSDRLARLKNAGHNRVWTNAGVTLLSVGLGALLAGIPLLSSTSHWDSWVMPVYASSVGVAFLLAGLCWLAARSIRRERADSVAAIKTDLDRLLDAYEEPGVTADIEKNVRDHFLKTMRREARESRRMIEQVRDSGQYWKMTETTPATKEWKSSQSFLEGDAELEPAYEAGRQAASEVERVLSARSFRMFRGGRVRTDDRLDDAVSALAAFEQALTSAMEPAQDDDA